MLNRVKMEAECIYLLTQFLEKKCGKFKVDETKYCIFGNVLVTLTLKDEGTMEVNVEESNYAKFDMAYDEFIDRTIEIVKNRRREEDGESNLL